MKIDTTVSIDVSIHFGGSSHSGALTIDGECICTYTTKPVIGSNEEVVVASDGKYYASLKALADHYAQRAAAVVARESVIITLKGEQA